MPPIDPPTTAAQRSMPIALGRTRACAATWSRMVRYGKRDPHSRPSGASDAGPVLPWQPPSMLGATTNQSVGVEVLARADDAGPPAGGRMPGPGRPDHVAVAGEGVQHEHRVAAVRVELAPGLVGDAHGGQVAAALERRVARCEANRRSPGGVALSPGAGRRRLADQRADVRLGDEARGDRCPRVSASPCLASIRQFARATAARVLTRPARGLMTVRLSSLGTCGRAPSAARVPQPGLLRGRP